MFAYYLWAIAEKTLSYVPYGKKVYQGLGYLVERKKKGTNPAFVTSFRMVHKAQETLAPGSTVLDVGTGWHHHAAFLLWLVGDYKIILFDVEDKAKMIYIQNYLRYLHKNIDLLTNEFHIDRETSLRKLEDVLKLETSDLSTINICLCGPKPAYWVSWRSSSSIYRSVGWLGSAIGLSTS